MLVEIEDLNMQLTAASRDTSVTGRMAPAAGGVPELKTSLSDMLESSIRRKQDCSLDSS